jgi:hypothetical protein
MTNVITFTLTLDDARLLMRAAHHAAQHLKYGYATGGIVSEADERDSQKCDALELALADALERAGAD